MSRLTDFRGEGRVGVGVERLTRELTWKNASPMDTDNKGLGGLGVGGKGSMGEKMGEHL